uniref:Uncharacterized protein n=1 Tax=Anopheles merus TaxID=30066 RepID=A0A182UPC8_ANOME
MYSLSDGIGTRARCIQPLSPGRNGSPFWLLLVEAAESGDGLRLRGICCRSRCWRSSRVIALKSVLRLKIGRHQSAISRPARSRFTFVSFGCLYRYITALPMPDCRRHGSALFGSGAIQSVSTFSTLCSRNASCRSFLISCDIACFSMAIFFVAGLPSTFSCRSCSAAWRICCSSCAIWSSLSLIRSMSFRLRRRDFSSFFLAIMMSKSDMNWPLEGRG